MAVIHGNKLGKALQDEGLIPPNCRLLEIVIPDDGAAVLRFECFVTRDDLPKISRALLANAEPPDANG